MKSNLANSKRYPTWWFDSIHRWFWHWNLWLSIAPLMAMWNFASAELLKNPRFYVPPLLLSVTFGLFTAWRNMIATHSWSESSPSNQPGQIDLPPKLSSALLAFLLQQPFLCLQTPRKTQHCGWFFMEICYSNLRKYRLWQYPTETVVNHFSIFLGSTLDHIKAFR